MSGSVQKNFRLPVGLAGRLADRAAREGVGQTAVVVGALEAALGNCGGPSAASGGDEAVPTDGRALASPRAPGLLERPEPSDHVEKPEVTVDFAVWLSGVTGMPRSLLRHAIALGRVSVDGAVVTALELSVVPARESVRFDGRPV